MKVYPLFFANHLLNTKTTLEVTDKFRGHVMASVMIADAETISRAIDSACLAAPKMAALPAYERQNILNHCVRRFQERAEEFAVVLCHEAGKPIREARGEVARLIDTFRIAAEEAVRITGEVLPLDISPRAKDYVGMWKRVAIGPCSFITPFNFPLNLVAHKIAPAIAAGCPFILKPASKTPLGALMIGEVLAETVLPVGAFSILPCAREGAELFTTDPRLKLLSFTGSASVGWDLKSRSGKKKVVLELGGNAACVVDADVNLADVVNRILVGAFYQSGQSCISVQRILAHESIYESLKESLVKECALLKAGDPREETTAIGPLISEEEAIRLERWIQSAKEQGAKILCGGSRKGALMEATLLEKVPKTASLCAEEAFGPVAILDKFSSFDAALEEVNASAFGLQAGIFTRDIEKALRAWDRLEVGGVVINDVPSWRVDHMPYGGVKDSGLGREGVRFAIEDMTEIRMLVIRRSVI